MNAGNRLRRGKNSDSHRRRGAAAVEGAIVLSVFLVMLFGMLDLGLFVLDYNTLAEATRRLARESIVHGQMAGPERTVWGPTTITGTAADGTEYGTCLRQELATFNLSGVNYSLAWPNGTNQPGNPVKVVVTYQYQPILTSLIGSAPIQIQGASTMLVAH